MKGFTKFRSLFFIFWRENAARERSDSADHDMGTPSVHFIGRNASRTRWLGAKGTAFVTGSSYESPNELRVFHLPGPEHNDENAGIMWALERPSRTIKLDGMIGCPNTCHHLWRGLTRTRTHTCADDLTGLEVLQPHRGGAMRACACGGACACGYACVRACAYACGCACMWVCVRMWVRTHGCPHAYHHPWRGLARTRTHTLMIYVRR